MSGLKLAVARLADRLGCEPKGVVDIPVGDRRIPSHVLVPAAGAELYIVDNGYWPEFAPFAIMNWGDGRGPEFLRLRWDVRLSLEDRLYDAVTEFIDPASPRRLAMGQTRRTAWRAIDGWSEESGLRRFLVSQPAEDGDRTWLARIDRRLSQLLGRAVITIVGLGSVGSFIAEHLVRTGVGHLVLIDPDDVEEANLSRTIYQRRHVGQKKVQAAAELLREIDPQVDLTLLASSFERVGRDTLRDVFRKSSLIVAATDDPRTHLNINRCAHYSDRPSVYVGMYPGAFGGEIVTSVPQLTPCFQCTVGRFRIGAPRPDADGDLDYGTGRLRGVSALGSDIHYVSSAALRTIVSLTAAMADQQVPIASFSMEALRRHLHMNVHAIAGDYWFFPDHFRGVSGQYAFQSVWLTGTSDPDCPVCGARADREDPFAAPMGDPDVSQLRP